MVSDRDERDHFSGRVRRYAKVGATLGGVGARMAGQRYLGLPKDRAKNAAELRRALGGLKGPLMKVAQLMATVPEAMPEDYVRELSTLQSQAPSMGYAFVRRRMASELGPEWPKRFRSFEPEAAAAASLGQVHRAVALNGKALACKLQYPDMASTVQADLAQLRFIFGLYRRYDPAIDTRHILEEIAARLREELDYEREASHMRLYAGMLDSVEGVRVPDVVPALSTKRLITMNWLDGESLLAFRDADQDLRNRLAERLFHAWYVPFYRYGVLHGDPHLGNYNATDEGELNLLDFGCIRVFSPRFVGGVIALYRAIEANDEAAAVAAYEIWGFKGLSRAMVEALNLWARYLYAPLLEDRRRRIDEGAGVRYGAEVAANVHREVRRLGGVAPPREFVLLDRSAIGLGSVFMHLNAELNWRRLFETLIEGFDAAGLERRQTKALAKAGVPAAF
ncbi:MAG: AarF/ABC1/UbiB kinase family protein [Alphaproteobacteria bacterium]|nr:AarF/ABC1/UbiB kinase family protein [Alphaproteobacteria bacterium]